MMIFQLSIFATMSIVILLSSQCASQATLMQKSTEVELDGSHSMELVCSVTGSVSSSRVWTGGPGFQPLITNGVSTDSSKYTETVQTVDFSLHVHNVIVDDVCGVDFKCTNGFFDSPTMTIVLNSSIFRYVPISSDIQVLNEVYDSDMKMTILVNLTTVFPEPTCKAEMGTIDITSKLQSNSYNNGNCGLKSTELRINNETYHCPAGQLVITCMVGSQSITAYRGSSPCQSVAKTNIPATKGLGSQGGLTAGKSGLSSAADALTKTPRFTSRVVRKWYFSSRYMFRGRVVYGIQILIIAAVTQVLVIIPAVIVLAFYAEENEIYFNVILALLILVWPAVANGLYLLYKAFFGQKEWIHIKFEEKAMYRSLSDDCGVKLNTINKDKIWFKVWAKDDVKMTLYRNKKEPFLDIILGKGARTRKVDDHKPVVVCDNVLSTIDYMIFYLICEENVVKVVRVLNGKEETVLEWDGTKGSEELDFRSEPLSDIIVSNYMRELKEKDVALDTGYLVDTKSQTGTPGEWIFFIRQGDRLYEDDDDFRVSKTSQLIVLVVLPFAWLVLPFLFFGKERNTKETKIRKDTDGKGNENYQPNVVMITTENVWINTPIGRKMPDLPAIQMTNQPATEMEDKKQKKKKKKTKNQIKDSSRDDIQQSQEDTENNTIQAVAD